MKGVAGPEKMPADFRESWRFAGGQGPIVRLQGPPIALFPSRNRLGTENSVRRLERWRFGSVSSGMDGLGLVSAMFRAGSLFEANEDDCVGLRTSLNSRAVGPISCRQGANSRELIQSIKR